MIRVELRQSNFDTMAYETVATLTVNNDGTHAITGDQAEVFEGILTVPVIDARLDSPAGPRNLAFADDPATWARNSATVGSSAYSLIVVEDDGIPAEAATTTARIKA